MTKNRILAITIALALTLSALTGCSSVPGMSGGSSTPNSGAQSDKSTPDNSSDSSSAPDASDAGSDKSGGDVPYYVGDSVSTAWFDFTVDSVEVMNEYEGYAAADVPNPDEHFYLRVIGDSMINAGIHNGDLVLLRQQSTAENGQIVACLLNGEDATLKRFRAQKGMVILQPENPAYEPRIIPMSDFDNGLARIVGVAVKLVRNL